MLGGTGILVSALALPQFAPIVGPVLLPFSGDVEDVEDVDDCVPAAVCLGHLGPPGPSE